MRRYSDKWPVGSVCSEVQVLAREQDLHEVLEGEEAVAFGVIEVHELLTISLSEQKYAIISQKCHKVATCETLLRCPIDSHEGAVG